MKKVTITIFIICLMLIAGFIGYMLKKPEIIQGPIKVQTQDGGTRVVMAGDDPNAVFISLRGSLYEKEEQMRIWAGVYNSSNKPIDSSCNLNIYYPNTTVYLDTVSMTQFNTGYHNYSKTAPNVSGTYFINVNCTRTSDGVWAMTDGELQIDISFIQRIRNLFSRNFRISSLSSVSPRYSSESVEVEATFTYFDGNITPSSINLTISDPNDNVWTSASLSDFTEDELHIFKYSKSLSNSPTTGKYSVKMFACFNSYCDAKVTQFRVATGGPYRYIISGKSSVCLDEPYGVTNEVTNEGEGDTETLIHNWLDIDDDGKIGSMEPQASFQKEVQGYGSFTEVIYLRTRDDISEGYYTIRGNASYVGGAQPPATSSFTVRVEQCKTDVPAETLALAVGAPEGINITRYIKELINVFEMPWWLWVIFGLIVILMMWRFGFIQWLFSILMYVYAFLTIYGVIVVLLIILYILYRMFM